MLNTLAQILLGFSTLMTSTTAPIDLPSRAVQWSCQAERWIAPSGVKNGEFKGTLTSDCRVFQASGNGISSLDDYLRARVAEGKIIHEGPIPETYEGLPGVRYDLSVVVQADDQPMTIRANVHLASDRQARFVYVSESKKIDASGMAGYLKRISERVEVTATEDGSFDFRLFDSVVVEKPWYVPESMFDSQVRSTIEEQFRTGRDERVQHWGSAL